MATKNPKSNTIKKEDEQMRTSAGKSLMITALKKSMGIVSTACDKVGIVRSTHYKWMDEDKQYRKDVEDITEYVLDFAESKLFESIEKDNLTATIFFLKTRAKKRGYVERIENVNAEVDEFDDLTDEELDAEIEKYKEK